ncbi:MAG: hypothetical protein J6Z32_00860 [Bacteroidales bacterium]|nr:hypothetical protein [Bacteroidales bacterium]
MKKYFILAAIAIIAMACSKEDVKKDNSKMVKVNLSVSINPTLTKCNFTLKDAANPISGMTVTWEEGDKLTLFVFQGDNASWTSKYIYKTVELHAAAEGLTTYDVSPLFGALDFSGFDPSKNLKYCVALGKGAWNEYWHQFTIYNGLPYINYSSSMINQINNMGMIAETDVKEIPFPGGSTLDLEGSLHWVTSVLAVQFEIDPAADITYPSSSYLRMVLDGSKYVDCYTPITKTSNFSLTFFCPIYFDSEAKLSDAVDANGYRYFTIPADNMTVNPEQKLGGSTLHFSKKLGSEETNYTTTGSISASAVIQGGKVYCMKIHVTDSDSDGNPEFTKVDMP